MLRVFSALLFLVASASAQMPANRLPQLDLTALSQPLSNLKSDERDLVDQATDLIRQGKHAEALASLTSLTHSNPMNSGLRVLRAYALLELGNAAGALEDATIAESAGGHAAYRCWFLAQVAVLAGNKPLCRREIRHVSKDPTYGNAARQLSRELAAK